ncbi:MAG: hypothetical protein AAF802_33045, partial [Planctomycetota bacterium]
MPLQVPPVFTAFLCILFAVLDVRNLAIAQQTLAVAGNTDVEDSLPHGAEDSDLEIARHASAVPREQCFPLESLPEASRALSKRLLLRTLDSESLFTLVGDLKPISEGFFSTWFEVEPAETVELSDVRLALSAWKCGEHFEAGLLPFQNLRENQRYASAWIASRPALDSMLKRHSGYFGGLGITERSTAGELLLRIEGSKQRDERWRGFGLAFGYPDFAIDFFVNAGMHYAETGEFVERDFRHYPTHSRAKG